MRKYRQYVLPAAIVLGLLLHGLCASLAPVVPWLIFTILLLTFSAVDLRKLRFTGLDLWLIVYQIAAAAILYIGITALGGNRTIAEGAMMAALCPVAASSTVVACMLGASRQTMTGYAVFGNIMVAVVAPLFFVLIGEHPEQSLGSAYLLMLGKTGSTLALPFFVALALQLLLPKANAALARVTGWSFYVWAVALLLTIGQTIHFIFSHGSGNWGVIAWLGVLALAACVVQFWLGHRLGARYGDVVSGGQLMGQKNSAMGIWMCVTFMTPLSSVLMAFYSIFQNLYNAWQIARNKCNRL
ncbi:MAG: hypothetical protein IJ760_04300 [Bacteroidales bacterium]|nr:hypothetical protein [Bacteroidales bacterium]